jgi:hypothetical protein
MINKSVENALDDWEVILEARGDTDQLNDLNNLRTHFEDMEEERRLEEVTDINNLRGWVEDFDGRSN